MSRFILTLTKQVPDKQYAHLCNKETSENLNVRYRIQGCIGPI